MSSSDAQSVRSIYWSSNFLEPSVVLILMHEICEHPVMSRCCRFVDFETNSTSDWLEMEVQNCVCRWVIFGHFLMISCSPLSVNLQPSPSITLSTCEHLSLLWSTKRLKMQFKALSPLTSPFSAIIFHRAGSQINFSNLLQTVASVKRSYVSSHWKTLIITSFGSESNESDACPLNDLPTFVRLQMLLLLLIDKFPTLCDNPTVFITETGMWTCTFNRLLSADCVGDESKVA